MKGKIRTIGLYRAICGSGGSYNAEFMEIDTDIALAIFTPEGLREAKLNDKRIFLISLDQLHEMFEEVTELNHGREMTI